MQVQAQKNAQKAIYINALYLDELVKRKKIWCFSLNLHVYHILGAFDKLSFLLSALSESPLLPLKISKDTQIALQDISYVPATVFWWF